MNEPPVLCYALANMDGKNKLYFGDNLKILREYVPDASVDLIYLDPPFNSSATYPSAAGCSGKERRRIRRADHGLRGYGGGQGFLLGQPSKEAK
jgi:DNA modification methylase